MSEGPQKPGIWEVAFSLFKPKPKIELAPAPDTAQPQETIEAKVGKVWDVESARDARRLLVKKENDNILLTEEEKEIQTMLREYLPKTAEEERAYHKVSRKRTTEEEKIIDDYYDRTFNSQVEKLNAWEASKQAAEAEPEKVAEGIKPGEEAKPSRIEPLNTEEKARGRITDLDDDIAKIQQIIKNKNEAGRTITSGEEESLKDLEETLKTLKATRNSILDAWPTLKVEKESVEPGLKQLVENIITGQYVLAREMEKGNIKKKKGAEQVKKDLEKILGKGSVKFRTNKDGEISGIERSQSDILDQEFGKQEEKEKGKAVRGIIKFVLGTATAVGITAAAVSAPLWLLAAAPAIFGIGASFIGRGLVEYVHGRRMQKDKKYSRVEIEKDDWKKYTEVLDLAKEIQGGNYTEKQAIVKLITTVKSLEEDSLERHKGWRKSEKMRKIAELLTGAAFGFVGLAGGMVYAKHELIEQLMKRGVDFDSNNVYHAVKKVKGVLVFLYQNSHDALDSAKRYVAQSIGKNVTELGHNAESYIKPMVDEMIHRGSILTGDGYGEFGAHALNTQTQESVTRYFNDLFNAESGRELMKNVYAGTFGIFAQFVELLSLRKPIQESEKKQEAEEKVDLKALGDTYQKRIDEENAAKEAEAKTSAEAETKKKEEEEKRAKEAEERAKEKFYQAKVGEQYIYWHSGKPYRFEVASIDERVADNPSVILKNIDNCPDLVDEDGNIAKLIRENRQTFNEQAEPWEHPKFTIEQWKTLDRYKKLAEKISEDTILPFVSKEAMEDLGLKTDKEYVVESVDKAENSIILCDTSVPRTAGNLKTFKLTDILTHLKMPTKKFEGEAKPEAKGGKDAKKPEGEAKPVDEQKENEPGINYEVGDQVEFRYKKDKDHKPETLQGKIIEFSKDRKSANIEITKDGATEIVSQPVQYITKKL